MGGRGSSGRKIGGGSIHTAPTQELQFALTDMKQEKTATLKQMMKAKREGDMEAYQKLRTKYHKNDDKYQAIDGELTKRREYINSMYAKENEISAQMAQIGHHSDTTTTYDRFYVNQAKNFARYQGLSPAEVEREGKRAKEGLKRTHEEGLRRNAELEPLLKAAQEERKRNFKKWWKDNPKE